MSKVNGKDNFTALHEEGSSWHFVTSLLDSDIWERVDSWEAAAYGLRSTASFLLKLKADPNATNFKVRLLVEIWKKDFIERSRFIPPKATQSSIYLFVFNFISIFVPSCAEENATPQCSSTRRHQVHSNSLNCIFPFLYVCVTWTIVLPLCQHRCPWLGSDPAIPRWMDSGCVWISRMQMLTWRHDEHRCPSAHLWSSMNHDDLVILRADALPGTGSPWSHASDTCSLSASGIKSAVLCHRCNISHVPCHKKSWRCFRAHFEDISE